MHSDTWAAEMSLEKPAKRAPKDLFERHPVFKEYFASSTSQKRKDQLKVAHPQWILEAERLQNINSRHKKDKLGKCTEGRYVFYSGACHNADCKSVHCKKTVDASKDAVTSWFPGGPPAGPYAFPTWDPDRDGSYRLPRAAWSLVEQTGNNTPDLCLPSKLLEAEYKSATSADKSQQVSLAKCHEIALKIKDSTITPAVVKSYCEKQRAIHLRRVAGAIKAKHTRLRNSALRTGGVVEGTGIVYKVEEIQGRRWNNENKCHEYDTKWLGFPKEQNTWETYEALSEVEAMDAYEKEHGSQKDAGIHAPGTPTRNSNGRGCSPAARYGRGCSPAARRGRSPAPQRTQLPPQATC